MREFLPLLLLIVTCFVSGCCIDNNECPSVYYCEKNEGNCKGIGICVEKPKGCFEIYSPVCGCDGITYDNDCSAAEVGENVLHVGECSPLPSWVDDSDCSS
jgi:hypothetical protein